MPEPVALLVVAAEGSSSLDRLRVSLDRYNADRLPLTVVATAAEALEVAAAESGAWVVVDPRVQFIRPFGRADVMADDVTPFVFASEERERLVTQGAIEADPLDAARADLDVDDQRRLHVRGLGAWSSRMLNAWRTEWLEPRGLSFADALRRCPDPHAWYVTWLQRTAPSDLALHAPIVAMLDSAQARQDADLLSVTLTDLSRSYLGVVLPCDEPAAHLERAPRRPQVLAESLSMAELSRGLVARWTRKAPRVQRWLGLTTRV